MSGMLFATNLLLMGLYLVTFFVVAPRLYRIVVATERLVALAEKCAHEDKEKP